MPRAASVTVTAAPGIGARVVSVTRPVILPRVSWASGDAARKRAVNKRATRAEQRGWLGCVPFHVHLPSAAGTWPAWIARGDRAA